MFSLVKNGELCYYKIDAFEKTGLVTHCFTTKLGGVSEGGYESLNLRISSPDLHENVLRNYDIICNELGISKNDLVLSKQVHETNIIDVTAEDKGNGIVFENKYTSADALVTSEKNVPLVTFYADCVPVYLLDTKKGVIALVHSGWKGTIGRIAEKTVRHMCRNYGSDAGDIIAAIGPSIRVCHYEVSDELAGKFINEFGTDVVTMYATKPHLDLQKCVYKQLVNAGINKESITDSGICTYCNREIFYSHRHLGDVRGTMAAIAMLK